jgi:endonuclease YncB( thermonuclease family)
LIKTKRRAYLLIAFILLSSVLTRADALTGTVTGVVDGNTITVRLGKGQQQLVSLVGVAAPDPDDCFGPASRSWLSDLTLGKKVRLEPTNSGERQRVLVKLLLADRDINLEIIRRGFARYNKEHELLLGEKERQGYQLAEAQARSAGIGLWSDPTPESACVNPNLQVDELQPVESSQGFPRGVKFYGRVTETYGGNGIAVMTADRARRAVCISYLETPESGQPYAEVAAQHLKDLLLGKDVTIFFRGFSEEDADCVIGDVYLGGVNVTLQMVRDGVAWSNKGYAYLEGYYVYEQAELAARGERRGLWQDPSPTPPWTYRAQHPSGGAGSPGGGFGYGDSSTRNADGRVHVRGYTRRDGTYVQPHTRSYPTRRH